MAGTSTLSGEIMKPVLPALLTFGLIVIGMVSTATTATTATTTKAGLEDLVAESVVSGPGQQARSVGGVALRVAPEPGQSADA